MALGDQIGEASGKIAGTRVLTPLGGHTQQIEVSFHGSGRLLGHDITDIGTYVQTLRPGGVLYGEGDVLYITADAESAQWRGFGVGRPTGRFPAGHFAVCGSTQTESWALRRLNEIATVAEYDVDQEGNYHYTTWRWHERNRVKGSALAVGQGWSCMLRPFSLPYSRTSWKGCSRKRGCSILHRTPPIKREMAICPGRVPEGDPYILWCWIDIRHAECSEKRLRLKQAVGWHYRGAKFIADSLVSANTLGVDAKGGLEE